MKKILIALDYNQTADKVAETGHKIAKSVQAEVMLLHVFTEPSYYSLDLAPVMGYQGNEYNTSTTALVEDIKEEAEGFLNTTISRLGDKNIKTILLEGDTTDSILAFSREWNADLIVMGSHSHKGIQRLLVPDIAAEVLKYSKIPLLTIPTEE